jgi:4-hydroxy-3-methylbut-2-enyl diphosphate reductase
MGGCYPLRPAPVRGGAAGVLEGVAATSSPRPAVLFSSRMMEETYFRKGFGLKAEVKGVVEAEYNSALVERIRARGYQETFGDVTVRLAQEFGFCYGVDRAVDYAYETVHKFPDRRIYLVGEIIHNPHVNKRMTEMGIRFIYPNAAGVFDFDHVTADDVVIMPAFGVTLQDFHRLRAIGCILVDTTCGSVLHVWKRVDEYARDGFTALIHGKHHHEESRATASQVTKHPNGKYVIVRDMAEAMIMCDYIAGRPGHQSREQLVERFGEKASPGFDPDRDLQRIGVANQTTMLANESLAIGAKVRTAMVERYGEEHVAAHFRSFGTICSATQERQDAVLEMMKSPPDVMIVIGGYNSSNTNHLAHMCRTYTTTFHVEDAACIDVDTGTIRHKPELAADAPEQVDRDWLPAGPFTLGITAGASTPNNKIGEAVLRVLGIRGVSVEETEPTGV